MCGQESMPFPGQHGTLSRRLNNSLYFNNKGMKTNFLALALVTVAIAGVVLGALATGEIPGLAANSSQGGLSHEDLKSASSENSTIVDNAPYPGYEYFIQYNTDTGSISGAVAISRQLLIQEQLGKGCPGLSEMSCLNQDLPSGVANLNITSYNDITAIFHHLGAFYVDLQTLTVQRKPGWTDCSNPYYGNGSSPCD